MLINIYIIKLFIVMVVIPTYITEYHKELLDIDCEGLDNEDDRYFDYYKIYSPYRGCIETNVSKLHNLWEDKYSVIRWDSCRSHCFYNELTIAILFDGNKCGCLDLSDFQTKLVHGNNCSLMCSGSFNQQCGGPPKNKLTNIYYAIQLQVCNPGYYGLNCAYPCMCKWMYPCNVMTGECGNGRVCAHRFEHYATSVNAFRCDRERDSEYAIFQFIYDLIKRIRNYFTREYEIPEACPVRQFGIYCLSECHCRSGSCDRISGVCSEKGCLVGWLGGRCDKADACVSNPCRNGGTCERSDQTYVCHCRPGHVGLKCHIVDPCLSGPCQNGGTCTSMDELFECKCARYYSGTLCTMDHSTIKLMSDYLLCVRSGDPALGESRDLEHAMASDDMPQKMTVEYCVKYCRIKQYNYAGLHDGMYCFCGNKYNSYGSVPVKFCNKPCDGNTSQWCGGFLTFSIHSTCPLGSYKMDCMHKCNCRGIKVQCDVNTGKCPNNLCMTGFTGDQCDQIIPLPTISMDIIMHSYLMLLALFPILGFYGTLLTVFRYKEKTKQYQKVKKNINSQQVKKHNKMLQKDYNDINGVL